MIRKIISGGQTGADQAALDAAIACGIDHGGWLPAGRKTEAGPLSSRYVMEEMDSPSYPERTRKNIMASGATLIVSRGPLGGGSALTARIAREVRKPFLHIDLDEMDAVAAVLLAGQWLQEQNPDILNVAGPRASSDGAIYEDVYALLSALLQQDSHSFQYPIGG